MTAPTGDAVQSAIALVRSSAGGSTRVPDPVHGWASPDPARLHALTRRLPELDFVVDLVAEVVIFHGPASAFVTVFGAVPAGIMDIPPTHELGGLLDALVSASVVLPPRSGRAFAGGDRPSPRDLLVGEIGRTLDMGRPDWLTGRHEFPAIGVGSAASESRDALHEYAASDLRRGLSAQIAHQRALGRAQVTAAVVEQSGPDLALPLSDLFGSPEPFPLTLDGAPFAVTDPTWETAPRDRGCSRWFRSSAAVTARADAAWAALQAEFPRLSTWQRFAGTARALTAELRRLAQLDPDEPGATPLDLTAAAALDRAVAEIDTVLGDPDVPDLRDYPPRHLRLNMLLRALRPWSAARAARYAAHRADVVEQAVVHGAMTTGAFLAVTLGDVPTTLVRHSDWNAAFWSRPPTPGARTVVSGSFGTTLGADVTAADAERAHLLTAARQGSADVLSVVAAGNDPGRSAKADGVPVEALSAGRAAIVVVGGCAPGPTGGWVAADSTVGLSTTVPAWTGEQARRVSSPEVTAVTRTVPGGSVVHPDGGDAWWFGSGSSLSTPIVAAVCALVWAVYPHHTAAQVKQAVLAGAEALEGGAFHLPSVGADPGSHHVRSRAWPAGSEAGRVCLEGALVMAGVTDWAAGLHTLVAPTSVGGAP